MIEDKRKEDLIYNIKKAKDILCEENLSETINALMKKDVKLGVAESLTGGMIASEIVKIPGTSSFLYEGITSYSIDSKIKRLGVKNGTLEKYTVVSEQVAKEMVDGILKDEYVNTAISTTGIAGPTGDGENQPIGLTYICVGTRERKKVKGFIFSGERNEVRLQAAAMAIDMLKKFFETDK